MIVMVKRIVLAVLVLGMGFGFLNRPVAAKIVELPDLPEQAGVYAVPGHPELKLHVLPHPARGSRPARPTPTPTPAPTLNCGLSDPESNETSSLAGWFLPTEYKYYLNAASVPASVGGQNLGMIAENGFDQWTGAINGKIKIVYVGTTTQTRARLDGQNIITWGRAGSGILGVTYIWTYDGQVAETDTIMNNIYRWSWADPAKWGKAVCAYPQSYDAQNILTHELGHWFGVDDDYDTPRENNTMYGIGEVMETKKDTLTVGDITAVRAIY